MELTFEKLPQAVERLQSKLDSIEKLLQNQHSSSQPEPDQLLTIQEAASLLKLTVATLYGKVNRAEIPVCKRSKRLYFSRHALIEWIKEGRKKTAEEIAEEARAYTTKKVKGGVR